MGAFHTPEEEVRNPGTGYERLAQIVQQRPDLAQAVVWHPNVYDGLLDWIAVNGDHAARSAVAARRAQHAPTAPATPAPPAPAAPAAQAPTPAPAQPSPTPPEPAPSAPGFADPAHNAYAPPSVAAAPGQPAPAQYSPGQPASGQPVAAAGHYDPNLPHAIDPSGSVPVVPFGGEAPKKKKRAPLLIGGGIALVLVVVLGAGAFWAFTTFFRGATSPAGAVDNLVDGVLQGDPVALMTAFSPSEVGIFEGAFDTLSSIETDEFDQKEILDQLIELHGTLDVDVEGMEYTTDYITDDIAVVYVVGGSITVDADPREFADAAVNAVELMMTTQLDSIGYTQSEITRELDDMRDEAEDWASDAFPATLDIDDVIYDFERDLLSDRSDDFAIDSPLMFVAVEEGGWYISPMLTIGEYVTMVMAMDQGVLPSDLRNNRVVDAAQFDTPEEAVAGTAEALEEFLAYGDTADLARVMALPERRLLSLYFPDFSLAEPGLVTIDEPRTTVDIDGNRARATIDELVLRVDPEGLLEYRDKCLTLQESPSYPAETYCLDDAPVLEDLGVTEVFGTLVKEDGGWLSSPLATYVDYVALLAEALQEHSDNGTLDRLFEDMGTGGFSATPVDPWATDDDWADFDF